MNTVVKNTTVPMILGMIKYLIALNILEAWSNSYNALRTYFRVNNKERKLKATLF